MRNRVEDRFTYANQLDTEPSPNCRTPSTRRFVCPQTSIPLSSGQSRKPFSASIHAPFVSSFALHPLPSIASALLFPSGAIGHGAHDRCGREALSATPPFVPGLRCSASSNPSRSPSPPRIARCLRLLRRGSCAAVNHVVVLMIIVLCVGFLADLICHSLCSVFAFVLHAAVFDFGFKVSSRTK
jgi:hypothetical protein